MRTKLRLAIKNKDSGYNKTKRESRQNYEKIRNHMWSTKYDSKRMSSLIKYNKNTQLGTVKKPFGSLTENPSETLDHLCYCTENIETFFMKIHKDDVETCVGVVYRSPNSNHSEFLETYNTITAQLKSNKNIHILRDFNTNLFKHSDPNTKNFEDHFLIEGLYPTVSIQTHKIGNTTGSCIDNIFISDVRNVICSGVIPGIGKHHSPIFTLASLNLKKKSKK